MTVKEAKQKNRQVSLSREIREEPIRKMLPTPTTQEFEHKDMELTHTNRRKTKDGKNSHSLNLADTVRLWPTPTAMDGPNCIASNAAAEKENTRTKGNVRLSGAVQMWPTPRVSDTEGGVVKNVELNNGNFSRTNKKGVRWGVKLKDAVSHVSKGSLNPDWVEWLMGYGQGYTDPDNKDKFTLDSHQGFPNEPEIARVTTENQYRKDRLKALGNSIVPQIAYHIGNAILKQEAKNES